MDAIKEAMIRQEDQFGTPLEMELQNALQIARNQLVTLGGDSSGLRTRAEAMECSVDMIQWEILQIIDEALSHI